MAQPSPQSLAKIDPDAYCAEAVEYLIGIVRSKPQGRQMQHGVAAAKGILAWATAKQSPEKAFISLFHGDTQAAAKWLRENRERLEQSYASPVAAMSAPAMVERTQ